MSFSGFLVFSKNYLRFRLRLLVLFLVRDLIKSLIMRDMYVLALQIELQGGAGGLAAGLG